MDYGPFILGIPGLVLGAVVGDVAHQRSFIRVTLPLALPGIFAGSLLTFIPAVGDYINAELLGNPQSQMIGNVIQSRFLRVRRLPDRLRAVVHPDGRDPDRGLHLRPRCSAPTSTGADEPRRATAAEHPSAPRPPARRVSTGPSTAGCCRSSRPWRSLYLRCRSWS